MHSNTSKLQTRPGRTPDSGDALCPVALAPTPVLGFCHLKPKSLPRLCADRPPTAASPPRLAGRTPWPARPLCWPPSCSPTSLPSASPSAQRRAAPRRVWRRTRGRSGPTACTTRTPPRRWAAPRSRCCSWARRWPPSPAAASAAAPRSGPAAPGPARSSSTSPPGWHSSSVRRAYWPGWCNPPTTLVSGQFSSRTHRTARP